MLIVHVELTHNKRTNTKFIRALAKQCSQKKIHINTRKNIFTKQSKT